MILCNFLHTNLPEVFELGTICEVLIIDSEEEYVLSTDNSNTGCFKVGTTRRMVAMTYGKRCGEVNLSILENLVINLIISSL